jgi:hypothetical protein
MKQLTLDTFLQAADDLELSRYKFLQQSKVQVIFLERIGFIPI